MADEPDVVVEVNNDDGTNDVAEVATATTAAEAQVAANESEDNAAEADAAALESWYAAESAWQAEQSAIDAALMTTENVTYSQAQIDQLATVASDLVRAAELQLQAQAGQQVSTSTTLPEPGSAESLGESETEVAPESNHWLTKKWFGK